MVIVIVRVLGPPSDALDNNVALSESERDEIIETNNDVEVLIVWLRWLRLRMMSC